MRLRYRALSWEARIAGPHAPISFLECAAHETLHTLHVVALGLALCKSMWIVCSCRQYAFVQCKNHVTVRRKQGWWPIDFHMWPRNSKSKD